ncbi:hypothetical protein QE152_g37957 [Popillia japonica]
MKVEQLESQLRTVNAKLDDQEQYSRSNNLRIYGLSEKKDENTEEAVATFLRQKLELDIQPHHISVSHRLKAKENRTRPILIRSNSRAVKEKIYDSTRRLKGQRIKEDLRNVEYN